MNTFHGQQDPNAILRGETEVQAGDTFINEPEGKKGFLAFRYDPTNPEPEKACMHFKFLGRGTQETCKQIATSATA